MMKRLVGTVLLAVMALGGGCAYRLAEGVVIAPTAAEPVPIELPAGKEVQGAVYYPYLVGYNLQEAIDQAFDSAGPEYDLLVGVTVDVKYYYVLIYYSKYVIVKGVAVKSAELKASLGEGEYQRWLSKQTILRRSPVDGPSSAEASAGEVREPGAAATK